MCIRDRRDRRVEADFSESAETAAAVSQLEVKPWRWLHDPHMVYGEYDAGRCCQKHQPCLIRLVLGPMFQSHIIRRLDVGTIQLDLGEDGDAGAPYFSIQKVETAHGQYILGALQYSMDGFEVSIF